MAVGHRLQVAGRTTRFDLRRELLEEQCDLVEPIAVLARQVVEPTLPPRPETLVPVPDRLVGAVDRGEDRVALLRILDLDLFEPFVQRSELILVTEQRCVELADSSPVSASFSEPVPGGGMKK